MANDKYTQPVSVNNTLKKEDLLKEKDPGVSSKEVSLVLKLYEEGKSYRASYDKKWKQYSNFYNGDQWDTIKTKAKSAPVVNIIRSSVQTILPIMTDTSPGISTVAQEPSDYKFATTMDTLIRSWWNRNDMDLSITIPILNSLIVDVAYQKVIWDPEASNGDGDIKVVNINPFDIYIPSTARSFKDACPWVIQRLWLPKSELKELYPDKASVIETLSNGERPEELEFGIDTDAVDTRSIDQWKAPNDAVYKGDKLSKDSDIEIYECWIRYPEGMRVITIAAQDKVLLQNKPSPYADNKFPFVRYIDTVRQDSFFGEGEVSPLIDTQRLLNKNFSIIVDYQNKMSNPTWILDSNCGISPSMLTNEVGLILTKNPGTQVSRQTPPPLPNEIYENYNILRQLMDTISGVHDVTQGRKPTGVTAASAIDTLQDAAQTRIRLKDRNLQASLMALGELVMSRMLQFYTRPRVVRVVGKDTSYPEYYEVYIKDDKGKRVYGSRKHEYNKKFDTYTMGEWAENPIAGDLDLVVKTGTSLPLERNNQRAMAIQLYQMHVIDDEELLKKLQYEDAEQILQRKQEQGPEGPIPGGGQ